MHFPKLFCIASHKDASMADILPLKGCYHDVNLICLLQDWKLELVASFMDLIYSRQMR